MSGKSAIGNRRTIVALGNSVGVTIPADAIDDLDVSRSQIEGLELPATVDSDGVFKVDLSEAERELSKLQELGQSS